MAGSLGLALSGGAILGAAHIGVLKALDDQGIRVTHLTGTSMGALVGSLYAFGFSGAKIEAMAEELRWPDVTRFHPSRLGLLSMDRLVKTLRDRVGEARIEDAPLSLALVAADISTGEKVVLREGPVAESATASACVPGVFIPMELDGRLLVDGGLVENLPISPLQAWGVETIVVVDVHMGRTYHRPRNFIEVLSNALDIALANAARPKVTGADVVVTPDLEGFSRSEMQDIPSLVEEGYRAMMAMMEDLRGEPADSPGING